MRELDAAEEESQDGQAVGVRRVRVVGLIQHSFVRVVLEGHLD